MRKKGDIILILLILFLERACATGWVAFTGMPDYGLSCRDYERGMVQCDLLAEMVF
jgi:hypothetical protein